MKTVIMAGGKGTRISSVASDIPKPMIKVCGKPVLEHEIECLRDQGFTDIIITVSHLGHIIMDYFGDGSGISPVTGESFGVNIEYFVEETPLGNAGALFRIKEKLIDLETGEDDFLLLNADSVFNIDFNRIVKYHKEKGGLVTLFTHPNSHPYDSGLIITDEDNAVLTWLTKEDDRDEFYKNRVNAGLHVVSSKLIFEIENVLRRNALSVCGIGRDKFLSIDIDGKIDLDRQVLKPLCGVGKMFAYDSPEYVKDMGTPDRYEAVCKDFEEGVVKAKNLSEKQRAIFLDRDGTINKEVNFLSNIEDFQLLPGAADAIKKINASGYLAIVITNQPVVARGEITFEGLSNVHKKLETLLGKEGAYIDGLYFCPHHPHSGFEGEIKELKIKCDCRKPAPGMIYKAAEDFNIDLSKSYMIGDRKTDVECGKNAGCKTAFIIGTIDEIENGQDYTADSLLEAVNQILK